MAFAFAFAGECFAQTAKPADTAGVFVSIDTVKRDGIKAYADSQKGFEEAARKAAGCLRALFMQNAFYKDKFIRYAEFSSAADAKKFADCPARPQYARPIPRRPYTRLQNMPTPRRR